MTHDVVLARPRFRCSPALGNFAGGVLAELFRVSGRVFGLAFHLAAGIVLTVVGLQLMPAALEGNPPWVPLLAFSQAGPYSSASTAGSDTSEDVSAI